jgi:UDP-N-acetylglucosamine--N-acetylmuramyl-(pentapeptide) pyrophosphoryl-undecaprenol N-acetylglucosamine transferase
VDSYFTDIPERLAGIDLVIARAGASTLSELTVMGRPSVLVPLAIAADDHQSANAAILKKAGAAWVLPERDFSEHSLSGLLVDLLGDVKYLENAARFASACAAPDAAERLADCILSQMKVSKP